MTDQLPDPDADPNTAQNSDFAIRRQLLQMEMLYEIGLAISQSLDPAYVAQEVLQRALVMVDAAGAVLLAMEQPENELRIIAQIDLADVGNEAAAVVKELQAQQVWDTSQLARLERPEAAWRYLCIVPLLAGQGIEGLLIVANKEHRGHIGPFSASDETLLQSFAYQAGNALVNARLHRSLEEAYEHLRQSQKMDALGQLAGGIAHDFNNLLTLIIGYSMLGLETMDEDNPMYNILAEIQAAGERAATLTRQLLAFSRKEVLQPEMIDLNEVVGDMSKMLLRLIGDEVELAVELEEQPTIVWSDRSQLEQVIMNLAVNARDAMSEGGVLRIQTNNVEVMESDTVHPGVKAGRYVLMSYADTGTGMDEATMTQVFRPFFTTKSSGRGTGLGLSMVYGIVEQSGGHIRIESQVGIGTTFYIYLPEIQLLDAKADIEEHVVRIPRGTETILLVEDEAGVRKMVRLFLEDLGYHVLGAADTSEGVAQFNQHGHVDLLLTDVVMPGSGGAELAKRLTASKPDLHVLYISGHVDATLERYGLDLVTADLVQKPLNLVELARRIREILDGEGMDKEEI